MSLINKIFKKTDLSDKSDPAVKIPAGRVENSAAAEVKEAGSAKTAVSSDKDETVKKTSSPAAVKAGKVQKRDDLNAYKILHQPLITEKATELAQFNKYLFKVPISATKVEIKKTIMNIYGVKPTKINIRRVQGKTVRRGRSFGRTVNWKKAIVTLAVNDKIEIYEGV